MESPAAAVKIKQTAGRDQPRRRRPTNGPRLAHDISAASKTGPVAQWIERRSTEPEVPGCSRAYCAVYAYLLLGTECLTCRRRWKIVQSDLPIQTSNFAEKEGLSGWAHQCPTLNYWEAHTSLAPWLATPNQKYGQPLTPTSTMQRYRATPPPTLPCNAAMQRRRKRSPCNNTFQC
eukprot:362840-Chlamydomonas_euryale.AAC.3